MTDLAPVFYNVTTEKLLYQNGATPEEVLMPTGPAGDVGNDGLSAYEVAVANGFIGTEGEWLESLVGAGGGDSLPDQTGKGLSVLTTDGTDAKWSQRPFAIDIREWAEIEPYTGGSSGTDVKGIIEGVADYLRTHFYRGKIILPPGKFRLDSGLDPAKMSGHMVEGAGQLSTFLVFMSSSGVCWRVSGADGYTGGGLKNVNLRLGPGMSSSSSYALYLKGDSDYQPSRYHVEKVEISSEDSGTWHTGVFLNGNDKTSGAQGIRHASLKDINVFNCNSNGFYLSNVVALYGENLNTSTGDGNGNDIRITGGGTTSSNSTGVCLYGIRSNGALRVDNCSEVDVRGYAGSIVRTNTANYVFGQMRAPGGISGSAGTGWGLSVV